MTKQQSQDWSGIWILTLIILFLAFCTSIFSPSTPTSTTSSAPVSTQSSPELRYVENRFRQEGYSAEESRQAAEAVIKFHNAQQNRR